MEAQNYKPGEQISIPAAAVEFTVDSHTIWIHSPQGSTILRIKCTGKIKVDQCQDSPFSHSDIVVDGDINICLSKDAMNS